MHRPDPGTERRNTTPPASDEPNAGNEIDRPLPDEDGPHDVPDEQVIEKTLPSSTEKPAPGR